MPAFVVPFRGSGAKRRLQPLAEDARRELARAMLADVLAACTATGPTHLVTDDEQAAALGREAGATWVDDPGGGQGAAVAAGLGRVPGGPVLVVNADLPCVQPRDLWALLGALPVDGLALVGASDGSTNALALARPSLFEPLYGTGSAARFGAHAAERGVRAVAAAIPNLVADVDSLADLRRVEARVGEHTRAVLERRRAELAA
ncbi:MAG: 2-phospho-L-lactate guanylyltransferase [Actinobacteria bacterium]|nr:2-phospho-L-lactate guanylyltransferase [Actinomycetota bacterium]